MFSSIKLQTIIMFSNALVFLHIENGCIVWSNFNAESHMRIQVLHINSAKIILSADYRTPTNDMVEALQGSILIEGSTITCDCFFFF